MRRRPTNEIDVGGLSVGRKNNVVFQERRYRVITHLFGGGVNPGKADPISVLTAKSIRGHLRFWWRATRGGQFEGDLLRMREVEMLIWGGASSDGKPRPSRVNLSLVPTAPINPNGLSYRDLPNDLKYGAFPLQQDNGSVTRHGFTFSLHLTFPLEFSYLQKDGVEVVFTDVRTEVEAAFWAWEAFGGIGARTRRGFGAVQLAGLTENGVTLPPPQLPANVDELFNAIEDGFVRHVVDADAWPANVPHLSYDSNATRIVIPTQQFGRPALTAWGYLLGKLKRFRQQRNPPTRMDQRGHPIPGRSKWPEPEAIRQVTHQRYSPPLGHPRHPGHPPIAPGFVKFPRAGFGLPIVFHFKDESQATPRDSNADPRETLLKLADFDRWSSPLILRVVPVVGGYAAIAVTLAGTVLPVGQLVLCENRANAPVIQGSLRADLTVAEARQIVCTDGATPLLDGQSTAVDAFLDVLAEDRNL